MLEQKNNEVASSLVNDLIKERRTERRWKNIRFVAWFALIIYIIYMIANHFNTEGTSALGKHVALIRLDGMIAPERDFSAQELLPIFKKAFKDQNAAGVLIVINSPGGTPVQAAIIHDNILALKKQYKKKVVVVGEDLLTSGAYYVAVAGDKIYANANTITGSIGVIMKGFGFVEIMKKLGIERRVYTAGNDKDRLDPFLPQTPGDIQKIQEVINEIHQNFVNAVMTGRKGKLASSTNLFSGDFWSGETALKLGLIDALGNMTDAMNIEFGTTEYKEYGNTTSVFKLLGGQINSAFDNTIYPYLS